MNLIEAVVEFIFKEVFVELIGGTISKLNKVILRLRGIEPKSGEKDNYEEGRVKEMIIGKMQV